MFKKAVLAIPRDSNGTLVRAAILLMFYGMMRRSEVCPPTMNSYNPDIHLTRADALFRTSGVTITIRHAKNTQKNLQ